MLVRRSLLVLAILMVLGPVAVYSQLAQRADMSAERRDLQFYTVQPGTVQVFVTGLGNIEAEADASLSFTRPGRVVEVLVELGDSVRTGQALVRLNAQDERFAYDRALLQAQLAQLQLDDLMDGVDEGSLRVAEANVDSAWGAYLGIQNAVAPSDLEAAELRYQQALAAYDAAVVARTNPTGGQPPQAYELLEAQVGAASFNAEIARLQLAALQNGNSGQLNAAYARVLQAQRELARVQAGPTETQIAQLELTVQQALLGVQQAEDSVNQKTLTAPFDGVVAAVTVEEGALTAPGVPVVQLKDITPLHGQVLVDEIDIRQVREGMSATVTLDALQGLALPGVIERISLVGENDNGIISYEVSVRLDGGDIRLLEGMTAEASVVVEERAEVLVVPNEFIRLDRQQERAFVEVVGPAGSLVEVEVRLGLRGPDLSEIVSGLSMGDVLAVELGSDRIPLGF